jgi:plasmid stabilization system protein ParE
MLDASAWWRANRPSAANLFDRELEQTLTLLSEAPDLGRRYHRARVPGLRRILLAGCRYHLYYIHDPVEGKVVVLAVWSAVRGRGPLLR